MNRRHFDALLALELRRAGPLMIRVALATAAGLGLLLVAGRGSGTNLSAVLVGTTVGYALAIPTAVLREKFDGTLGFLVGLPTTPGTIAAAKLAGAALAVLPGAAQVALAVAWLAPRGLFQGGPFGAALVALVGAWVALTCLSFFMASTIVRFELQTMAAAPVTVGVIALILGSLAVDRFVPDPLGLLRRFLAAPWAPAASALAGLALAVAMASVSWRFSTRGIAHYRPRPEALTW